MKKKMVVLSLDALGAEDEYLVDQCPYIRSITDQGVYVPRVESVYPTLTYPAHTTLITGRYPNSHGIVNNTKVQPERKAPDWFWHAREIKGDTLFKACRRERKKVGAIFWPVSAGARIEWNLAEIWPHRAWQNQVTVSLMNSNVPLALRSAKKFGNLLQGIEQPQLDDFAVAVAKDVIFRQPFDALFVHFTDIDAHKHRFGARHQEVTASILRTDRRVGEVIDALDAAGVLPDTDICLVSDHSQRNILQAMRLNQIFYRHGLLDTKGSKIVRWQAYANTAEGSAYVYVKGKDPELVTFVGELLHDIRKTRGGIDEIYTREEIESLGGDPNCAYYVTAERGCVFSNSLEGDIYGEMDNHYRANHGYPPTLRNYEAMFAARGPSFATGFEEKDTIPMIDIAPTLAKALGVDLRGAAGIVREAYLCNDVRI